MTPVAAPHKATPEPPEAPTVTAADGRTVSLTDRYELEDGAIFLTGVQALVRVLLDQRRADRRRGLQTAGFVSGYEGSPLGTLDLELGRHRRLLDELEIVHRAAVNEELGATAAWGAQLAPELPGGRVDGVISAWYGKAPGLDRAGDALRHGNWVGVGPKGAALAMVGDDPASKSSTIPSASELALADFGMPIFHPGGVQEVLDYGLHALACSRHSGVWSAIKMVAAVADASATALVSPQRVRPVLEDDGRPEHHPHARLLAPETLDLERSLLEVRLERARRYAVVNRLYERPVGARDSWLGIVASGRPYNELREALVQLGVSDDDLARWGVALLKPAMIFPLDPGALHEFASGLDEILVIEEKRPFVESQVKDALYGLAKAPRVVGKRDEQAEPLLPSWGELEAHVLADALLARLAARVDVGALRERADRIRALATRAAPPVLSRTPFFCSGCPHNRSTDAPDGSVVGAGTGCHSLVLINPTDKGEVSALTQMGGEGAQWIGVAPFSDAGHFVQNMGDGTFHHSGSLSVRNAVAAGLDVTFKLYYNQAVAMTGGQAVPGVMSVPALTVALQQEGVSRTIVTTDEPARYRGVRLASNAEVRDRREILAAQTELAATAGVTVLVHDQRCAAEKRRLRKRGRLEDPERRVVINERVCEGCGDCGRVSDCLSVRPVDTEFGRKTQIHQPSCNKDYSCLEGDCPSFVTVTRQRRREAPGPPPVELPEPEGRPAAGARIRMTGVGGTGVITASQVLGMAAMLDGKQVAGLDQTGMAQKGGPVVSDLLIGDHVDARSNKGPVGGVDLYLVFDVLTGAQGRNLSGCDTERTVAVVSTSEVATGAMVVDPEVRFPAIDAVTEQIVSQTRVGDARFVPAEEVALGLFDDDLAANTITLGAAFQAGLLPVSIEAIERAFVLNGAAAERNLAAFAWGRACVAAPAVVASALRGPEMPPTTPPGWAQAVLDGVSDDDELRRLVEIRVRELADYQSDRYARRYAELVVHVRRRERDAGVRDAAISRAVARQLYRLMAYKDEYEVARLHLLEAERAKLTEAFGEQVRVHWHLHPPLLRALGLRRKIAVGPWFRPAFVALRALRRLRGTPFDLFGYARVRRIERDLVREYRDTVETATRKLSPANRALVLELCDLPERVRGYEEIKLANVRLYRRRLAQLRDRLDSPTPTLRIERVA